jgi:hypothetical protein
MPGLLRRAALAPLAAVALLAVVALLAASAADGAKGPAVVRTRASAFPAGSSLTLARVRRRYGNRLAFAAGAGIVRRGSNRLPFLVLDDRAEVVRGAQVALYTTNRSGTRVRGPFPAVYRPFGIGPAYLSRTTASDPQVEKAFYVAQVPTPAGRPTALFALVKVRGKLEATSPTTFGLTLPKGEAPPPDVGDRAIPMHTLTATDVGGDYAKVTTRIPPDKDLVSTDFADVLGRKPVVLVFATPLLCQSRVCGPTVDVAEQVKGEFGDRVAWVHQEIYVDNVVKRGLRPQVRRWRLLTEPWVFAIDRHGTIVARAEGAVSVPELTAMVRRALRR